MSIALVGVVLAVMPTLAQTKPAAADVPEAPSRPAESSLVVGALQIGSAADLVVKPATQ